MGLVKPDGPAPCMRARVVAGTGWQRQAQADNRRQRQAGTVKEERFAETTDLCSGMGARVALKGGVLLRAGAAHILYGGEHVGKGGGGGEWGAKLTFSLHSSPLTRLIEGEGGSGGEGE